MPQTPSGNQTKRFFIFWCALASRSWGSEVSTRSLPGGNIEVSPPRESALETFSSYRGEFSSPKQFLGDVQRSPLGPRRRLLNPLVLRALGRPHVAKPANRIRAAMLPRLQEPTRKWNPFAQESVISCLPAMGARSPPSRFVSFCKAIVFQRYIISHPWRLIRSQNPGARTPGKGLHNVMHLRHTGSHSARTTG